MDRSVHIINEIERRLNKVSEELARDFRELLEAGKVALPLHPAMLKDCQTPLVQDLLIQHSKGEGLSFSELRSKTDGSLQSPLPEADAKVLKALIQEHRQKLSERLTIVVANNLKSARLETGLVKEGLEYLDGLDQRVEHAQKLGLGDAYRNAYTDYGTPISGGSRP
ncbi:hypothetical protein ACSSZE_03515 [Acidithiobacillus caldus]